MQSLIKPMTRYSINTSRKCQEKDKMLRTSQVRSISVRKIGEGLYQFFI